MKLNLEKIFINKVKIKNNLIILKDQPENPAQRQTNEMFSEKWSIKDTKLILGGIQKFQQEWYLKLYGFKTEKNLKKFLQNRKVIFDAGCGLGYKTAWFANLAPESYVIGMDYSDSVINASKYYKNIRNLFFVKGDIATTNIKPRSLDYISCDQVIHHTENPEKTFSHLSELLKKKAEFSCYVYAKKALPRELLDDHFRTIVSKCTKKELWDLSAQLTQLGKTLSELKLNVTIQEIPLLGIKGGEYDIQRFIYWNFLKCFWNEEFGWDNSVMTNFDWYSPVNAARYNEKEFRKWVENNLLKIQYFHKEEACFSGRFLKSK
jgi:SAM-dependent methyltransferase